MIYHFVVGDLAAHPLSQAVQTHEEMKGEVVVMRDLLNLGPLEKAVGQSFAQMRSNFWQTLYPHNKTELNVDDLERVLEVSTQLNNFPDREAWIWVGALPADVSAYYFLLHYLQKHLDKLRLVQVSGLPFLSEQGKLFFPESLAEIIPSELIKARKLARPIPPSEFEVDIEEWNTLCTDNAPIRKSEGGKKLSAHEYSLYDATLMSFCSQQFSKASRIISQAISKYKIPTGDVFLAWRLRKMAEEGWLVLEGQPEKGLKEFSVKRTGDTIEAVEN